jgi:hypothetical protein
MGGWCWVVFSVITRMHRFHQCQAFSRCCSSVKLEHYPTVLDMGSRLLPLLLHHRARFASQSKPASSRLKLALSWPVPLSISCPTRSWPWSSLATLPLSFLSRPCSSHSKNLTQRRLVSSASNPNVERLLGSSAIYHSPSKDALTSNSDAP